MNVGRRPAVALLCCLLPLASLACRARRRVVVVGSKNFTEQLVLGELLAQAIENPEAVKAGRPPAVTRRLDLGGTFLCHQALLSGQIDVYPEYTGTALTAIFKQAPVSDPAQAWREVRDQYHRLGLEISPPLGFDDTFAILVRPEDAAQWNLHAMSDLQRVANRLRPGFGYEFMERQDGFAGWSHAYQLSFGQAPRIMDLGLLYTALAQRQVDLIAGNSTDGRIAALGLVQLTDDRHYFPAYQAFYAYRPAAAANLRPAFARLAGRLDNRTMQAMNAAVDLQHRDPAQVAGDFLKHLDVGASARQGLPTPTR